MGAPPATALAPRPVLASIAVIEFDRRALADGSTQLVTKTALHSYELFVISEARPLLPASLHEPGTEDAFWKEAEAVGSSDEGRQPNQQLLLLVPTMQPATAEDMHLIGRAVEAATTGRTSLPPLRTAAVAECEVLAVNLAGDLKLQAAMDLLNQARGQLAAAFFPEHSMRVGEHLK